MTLLWPFFLVPAGICALALIWFRDSNGEDDWRRVIDRRISAALRPGGAAGGGPSLALMALVIVLAALASPRSAPMSTRPTSRTTVSSSWQISRDQ